MRQAHRSDSSNFLEHLARRGAGSIHPLGRQGTEILIHTGHFKDGERVLEFGCGTGETLVRIASGKRVCLTGIDASSAMSDCARRRCDFCGVKDRVEIKRVPHLSPWPIEDASLDVVYAESVMAILESESRRGVLREVLRVLRPGGRFIFLDSIWQKKTEPKTIVSFNQRCRETYGIPQATEDWVGEDQCESELIEAGFGGVSSYALGDLPTTSSFLAQPVLRAMWRSRLFTLRERIRAMLSLGFLVREFHYFRVAPDFREVGCAIESLLFVAHRQA